MDRLESLFRQVTRNNIQLLYFLSLRIKALNRENIPIMLMKGAHLAELVYDNIALRPMADVDILIRKKHLVRTQEVLEGGGKLYPGEVTIDIHWHIAHSLSEIDIDPISHELAERIDIDGIWERSEPAVIAGEPVRVMSPEDLLLHLCIHLAVFHLFQYNALKGLCDLRETISRYALRLSWERVAERAEAWGIGNAVTLCLRLARDLLDAPIPDGLPPAIDPDGLDDRMVNEALGAMFRKEADTVPVSPKLWQLFHFGTFSARLRMVVRLLFPSPQCIPRRFGRLAALRSYLAYWDRLRRQLMLNQRAVWKMMAPRRPSDDHGRRAIEMKTWLCGGKSG